MKGELSDSDKPGGSGNSGKSGDSGGYGDSGESGNSGSGCHGLSEKYVVYLVQRVRCHGRYTHTTEM